jgi:hypothetical protein
MSNDERFNEEERLEQLAARLRELPAVAEPARDLWPGIAARIAAREISAQRPRRGRAFFQTAAALAIFAVGVLVGRGTVERPAEISRASQDPLRAAAEVQRTGSQYIAALSSLTSEQGPALLQGREAALSTLYGAAYELDKLPSEDLSQVLRAVSASQRRTTPAASRAVPF